MVYRWLQTSLYTDGFNEHLFSPFPKWQILGTYTLKKFADNNFQFDENGNEQGII